MRFRRMDGPSRAEVYMTVRASAWMAGVCLVLCCRPLSVVGQTTLPPLASPATPIADQRATDVHRDDRVEPASKVEERPTALSEIYTPRYAQVTGGTGTLPHEHGQVWREYDISPFTLRVASTSHPEQLIIDWILRETGYEIWHSDVVSVLSSDGSRLRVYHTPEIQAVVARVVDRFVRAAADSRYFNFRVVTLSDPQWRAKARGVMQPVQTQTPGTAAWVMDREDAVMLLSELRRRVDFRELNSPHQMVAAGRSTVLSSSRAKNFIRRVTPQPNVWPGFVREMGAVDEGYALEFSPLLSVDGNEADLVVNMQVNQVEKFVPVILDVPTTVGGVERVKIEVPQTVQWHYQERFRWPADAVLLIDLGMVPVPESEQPPQAFPAFALPIPNEKPGRANALVFVECQEAPARGPAASIASPIDRSYNGRY
ncbi:hypothetical protein JCM19992_10920 [Thermostilla marina]